jgi:DNA-binding CsgD family transcriptional regulator
VGLHRRNPRTVYDLTRRERQVLQAAAFGLGVKETAARLGIGAETVKTHRRSAIMVCDARNTTHAVAIAWRVGMIV